MRGPRTVLMVGPPATSAGGMGSVAAALTRHAASESGWTCRFVDSGGGTGRAGYRRFPRALAQVASGRYDLLHLHVASRGSTLRKAGLAAVARTRGRPYLVHLHGARYEEFLSGLDRATSALVRDFFLRAEAVIVLGEAWRTLLMDRLGVPAERLHVVHNGTPPVLVGAPAPRAGRRLLWMGDLTRRKGLDLLLEALPALLSEPGRGDVEVVLAGTQPEADLVAEAERIGRTWGGRVVAPGPVFGAEKAALFEAATVFCLPSRAEGLPMVLLEAMSAALPCVTTRVGSIPEVFPDGREHGVVWLDRLDADDLRVALAGLLDDRAEAERIGRAGRARWEEEFTGAAMGRGVARVWSACLRQGPPVDASAQDRGAGPVAGDDVMAEEQARG